MNNTRVKHHWGFLKYDFVLLIMLLIIACNPYKKTIKLWKITQRHYSTCLQESLSSAFGTLKNFPSTKSVLL